MSSRGGIERGDFRADPSGAECGGSAGAGVCAAAEEGRERGRGLPDRRNFARQHRLEISCSHPERRAACVRRGEERLPVPRGLLRPPLPSPAGKHRVVAAGCGGSVVLTLRRARFPGARGAAPGHGGSARCGALRASSRGCQKGLQHCRPPAQLGPRALRAPRSPPPVPPASPVRDFSIPPGGVPTPRSPSLSPLPPQGNAFLLPPQSGGPLPA